MTELSEVGGIRVQQNGENECFQLGTGSTLQSLFKFLLEPQHGVRRVYFGVNTNRVAGFGRPPPFLKRSDVNVLKGVWIRQLLCDDLDSIPVVYPIDRELGGVILALFVASARDMDCDLATLPAIARLKGTSGL